MKKVLFIVTIFVFTLFGTQTISAKKEEIIIKEETHYYEEYFDDNGKVKIKELDEKSFKEKKEKKEKLKAEEIEIYETLALGFDSKLFTPETMSFIIDDGGTGGGSNPRTSLSYHPNTTLTNLNCIKGDYYYCSASAVRDNPMTELRLKVSYNPTAVQGMVAEATLTWDDSPSYSIEDYLSISFSNDVSVDDNTIVGEQTIEYYEIDRYWWGGIKSRTYGEEEYIIEHDGTVGPFQESAQGVIWIVEDVYKDYDAGDVINGKAPGIILDNGTMVEEAQIISAEYKLTFNLDSEEEDDGNAIPYENYTKISFAADYLHTYMGINLDPKATVRVYFTAANPTAFLGLDLTYQKCQDDSRRITVDFYNYNHQ